MSLSIREAARLRQMEETISAMAGGYSLDGLVESVVQLTLRVEALEKALKEKKARK